MWCYAAFITSLACHITIAPPPPRPGLSMLYILILLLSYSSLLLPSASFHHFKCLDSWWQGCCNNNTWGLNAANNCCAKTMSSKEEDEYCQHWLSLIVEHPLFCSWISCHPHKTTTKWIFLLSFMWELVSGAFDSGQARENGSIPPLHPHGLHGCKVESHTRDCGRGIIPFFGWL